MKSMAETPRDAQDEVEDCRAKLPTDWNGRCAYQSGEMSPEDLAAYGYHDCERFDPDDPRLQECSHRWQAPHPDERDGYEPRRCSKCGEVES